MVSARDDNYAGCDWIPDNFDFVVIARTRNDVGGGFPRIKGFLCVLCASSRNSPYRFFNNCTIPRFKVLPHDAAFSWPMLPVPSQVEGRTLR